MMENKVYKPVTELIERDDLARLVRIALKILHGEADTMIVRKNYKGHGLYIKGLKNLKD